MLSEGNTSRVRVCSSLEPCLSLTQKVKREGEKGQILYMEQSYGREGTQFGGGGSRRVKPLPVL